ncbi:BnaA08g29520D [Brassica napus]|uniref:BnaA08g29520D protein n=1 Tax=Brassica napus TaxID=3708 RepID=A0A078J789_BRANA|nr:BnaA08g29520D [Brassica napus]
MENGGSPGSSSSSLQASMQEFNLFETQSNLYMIGWKCGLKLVTLCYGIIGFIKFLGPYYILVITERREIGEICGHRVYEVSKSEIISLRNPSVLSNIPNSRDENRCTRSSCVWWTVDSPKSLEFSPFYRI